MGNNHGHHDPGTTHDAVPLDPENDIDARSATIWVLAGTVVLFLSLWVMLPIFTRVQDEERKRKVDAVPAQEFESLLATQRQFLEGANPTKKKLDQVLKDLGAGK